MRWCGGIVSAIGAGDIQTCANEDAEPPLALCSGSTARRRQVHSARKPRSSLDGGRPLHCRAQPASCRPSCTQQVAALYPASHHAAGAQIGQLCEAVSVCCTRKVSLHPPWRQCSEHGALAQSHSAQSDLGVVIRQWRCRTDALGSGGQQGHGSQPARAHVSRMVTMLFSLHAAQDQSHGPPHLPPAFGHVPAAGQLSRAQRCSQQVRHAR